MGFSKATAAWFSVLGGDSKASKLDMDSMDMMDAMEQGFSQTLARSEVKPEATEAPRRKLNVVRSQDRLKYVLHNEDLAPVLEARVVAKGVEVFAVGENVPAFTITHDKEKMNWQIASSYCDRCAYRNPFNSCKDKGCQTLAFVRHAKEEIGEGTALCMDADIPQIGSNGEMDIWCPLCSSSADDSRIELSSMRPKWNEKLKSLTMDFKGRVEAASAKNFQLCRDGDVVLLYGKKANGTFALEFEHPLSTAQAFSIALTTMNWI